MRTTTTTFGGLLIAGALVLSACSSSEGGTGDSPTPAPSSATSASTSESGGAGASAGPAAQSSDANTSAAPAVEGADKQLVLGQNGDIPTWDPSEMKEGAVIQYAEAVYDPLLRKKADATIEGNLATDFTYNDTLTELTLKLRDGVVFSDGEKFDGEAVKANLEHAQKAAGSAAEAAKSISSVSVTDPSTVVLKLAAPNPGLLSALATYAGFMVSPKALAAGTAATEPIGTGPYVLDAANSQKASSYLFTKNPAYWNSEAFPFGSVVIKPFEDFTARFNALKTGQIQFMYGKNDMVDEAKASGLTVGTVPGEWQGVIMQDRAGTVLPALADVRVRQAINMAFDRQTIVDTYYGGFAQVSEQTFNPASEAWVDALNTKYPYDPAAAKALLAEAGYPNGFELPIGYSTGFMDPLVAIVTQYLGDIGITVKPVPINGFSNGGLDSLLANPVYMLSFSTNIPAWTDVLNKITPTSLWNHFKYEDPKVTQLLTDIPNNAGAKQADLYKELNTYLVDQAWFAPIATIQNIYLWSPQIDVTMQQSQLVPSLRFFKPAS
ncbi:peptide ABC transporter substrate-binding protein [Nakamurella antarctica]|uniref:Peptide ABC transporter substrate-binding protein n=1 Tax=Nakamurella antarctica TaxID=1902245 RepID=A0A3G8ZJ39_9ACTN|nr:ABC transporter substrate-binding protein [Nakamurella antarctica]AZI57218.1 peptide ABC transporter substrate-binding protein [Nakamurella antarctica]